MKHMLITCKTVLTQWGRYKMDAISQTFSIAFSWMKIFEFWLQFDWLKSVSTHPINNIPAMVQIMAWRRPCDNISYEPMMISLPTPICVIWPQRVNGMHVFAYTGELSGKPRFQCHHERKSEACNACGKLFRDSSSLESHISSMHRNQVFPCTLCSNVYKTKHGLTTYVKQHGSIFGYMCYVCGKQFSHKS